MEKLWIVDDAVADIINGAVTLRIAVPVRCLPRVEAYGVAADKKWFKNQMEAIERAKNNGQNSSISLTKKGSALRLGGGFLQIQGNTIVIPRRTATAPTRPSLFCECGGLFEETRNDFLESALVESAEIIRIDADGTLYIPQLSGEAARYNQAIELETLEAARLAEIQFSNTSYIPVNILWPRKDSVILRFADSIPTPVIFTHEIDTSSLECVGLLCYDDLPSARFQDTESYVDAQGQFHYLNRETHVINYLTGQDTVWQNGCIIRSTSLIKELGKFNLTKTRGRYTNEKVEKAIDTLPFDAPALRPLLKQPPIDY